MTEFEDALGGTFFEQRVGERTYLERAPGQGVCDFCLAPNPTWEYPCGPMPVASTVIDASDDEWAACEKCHELIEAGDAEGLIHYSVMTQRAQPVRPGWFDLPLAEHLRRQKLNVENFMAAREGPARPLRS